MSELDAGVFRVDRRGEPSWVARVFPPERAADDGRRGGAAAGPGAGQLSGERCRARRAGVELGRAGRAGHRVRPGGVGAEAGPAGGTPRSDVGGVAFAARDPVPTRRRLAPPSFTGGPREEIAAAGELLDDSVGDVPARQLAAFDRLRDAVDRTDDCDDLPHALVHPDFVQANAIPTPDERLVIVDWTGAGRGPRLWSLGFMLWAMELATPGWSRSLYRATASGSRSNPRNWPGSRARSPADP